MLVTACGGPASREKGSGGSGAGTSLGPSAGTTPDPGTFGRYVALGDSYTAAPYVYLTDLAKGCLRSDHNYPKLLARRIGAELTDVSCSGATTADIARPRTVLGGRGTVPPQIDAVTKDTRLVTIGIGGNDEGLFGGFVTDCAVVGAQGQTSGPLALARRQCGNIDLRTVEASLRVVGASLTRVLRLIRQRAPQADVVLVGYPRIASASKRCGDTLPVTRANGAKVDRFTRLLSQAMSHAASTAGVRFLDMYTASKGHDVCAGKRAWINGRITDPSRAAALHPFALEQRAVAKRLATMVG